MLEPVQAMARCVGRVGRRCPLSLPLIVDAVGIRLNWGWMMATRWERPRCVGYVFVRPRRGEGRVLCFAMMMPAGL